MQKADLAREKSQYNINHAHLSQKISERENKLKLKEEEISKHYKQLKLDSTRKKNSTKSKS